MARSDLLTTLIRSGAEGDQDLFRRTAEAIIADEKAKKHTVLAERLTACLSAAPKRMLGGGIKTSAQNIASDQGREFLHQIEPKRDLGSLLLSKQARGTVRELIEEHHRRDLLFSYGLTPRHRILLAGPPGNGKTTLAEAVAYELSVPLFVVRYDALVGSFLGETGARLRRLFDFVRLEPCVLFFDEFDAVGKERGDIHETGEIKRVVSTLLMQIDRLPDYVVTIAASNHAELLDRAVWRRFQLRLELSAPTQRDMLLFIRDLASRLDLQLGVRLEEITKVLKGLSYAEVEEFLIDIRRRQCLSLPNSSVADIVRSRLLQWSKRYTAPGMNGNGRGSPAPSLSKGRRRPADSEG